MIRWYRLTIFCQSRRVKLNFYQVSDDLQIKRLQPQHKTFVAEYVHVMGPLCCGLDVLQGDKIVGLGHLLPTISIIRTQLNQLLTRSQPMSICDVDMWTTDSPAT
jgi:hypothetical protein